MRNENNPSPKSTAYANASLILAAASLILGPFAAVPGIVCGHIALSRMRKNPAIDGYGRALAGTILGYSFMIVFAAFIGIFILWFAAYVPTPSN